MRVINMRDVSGIVARIERDIAAAEGIRDRYAMAEDMRAWMAHASLELTPWQAAVLPDLLAMPPVAGPR